MLSINITGFTSAHNSGSNTKNIIGFSNLIKEILTDNGYYADYNLKNADINIVFVFGLGSLNTRFAAESMELLRQDNCIIAFDDWAIKDFYTSMRNLVEKPNSYKTHPWHGKKDIHQYEDVAQKILNGEYKVLFPAYKTGNHELLNIVGKKYCLDPSIYIQPPIIEDSQYDEELLAVHASLATKWKDLEKKKYTVLNVRGEDENAVFRYYNKHRIVISPEHYFSYKAGWFRNRYSLANMAQAVIIEEDNSCFGLSYNIQRKDVNFRNIDALYSIQNKAYNNVIMSKEEINKVLKEVLNG
jgi:hypothetical protein